MLDEVLYFESEKDYVFIYTKKKRYMALLSLKQLEKELPPERFVRVHRSFLVPLDKVEKMENHKLVIGKSHIPVSRSLQDEIYERLIGGRLWRRET